MNHAAKNATTLSNHSRQRNSYLKIFGIQLCLIDCLQQCLDNGQLAAHGSHVQRRTPLCVAASCVSAVPPHTDKVNLEACTLTVTLCGLFSSYVMCRGILSMYNEIQSQTTHDL